MFKKSILFCLAPLCYNGSILNPGGFPLNIAKKLITMALAVVLLLTLTPTVRAENESAVTPYAQQMLQYYLAYQEDAKTDIDRLLYQMGAIDASQADAWRSIMSSWSYAHSQMALNPGVLPDGLPEDDSLCIVVLGYALASDGQMQKELVGRLNVALASAEKYPNAYILCTGGGTAADNKKVTEAGQMASWLIRKGIDQNRVIVENRSYSTSQNALYSYDILRDQYPQVKHLAMVTSDYHMSWGYMAFATKVALGVYVDLDPYMDIVSNAVYSTNSRKRNLSNEYNQIVNVSGIPSTKDSAGPLSRLTSISVLGNLRYYVGDTLNLTVIAGYDNGYTRDVTAEALITDVEMRIPGTRIIQIQYEENGVSFNTDVEIELLYLEEGATHPSEPEVVLAAENTEEPTPQKENRKAPLALLLILAVILIVAFWFLTENIKKAQRRRKRRRPKMNL